MAAKVEVPHTPHVQIATMLTPVHLVVARVCIGCALDLNFINACWASKIEITHMMAELLANYHPYHTLLYAFLYNFQLCSTAPCNAQARLHGKRGVDQKEIRIV